MTKKVFNETIMSESLPSSQEEHRCGESELDEFIDLLATSEFPDELKQRALSILQEAEATDRHPSDQAAYVTLARIAGGSWSEIASAAGVSKSSAYHRWSHQD
jgi:DNA-directed RNA polymerase specialized sigma24 family protein